MPRTVCWLSTNRWRTGDRAEAQGTRLRHGSFARAWKIGDRRCPRQRAFPNTKNLNILNGCIRTRSKLNIPHASTASNTYFNSITSTSTNIFPHTRTTMSANVLSSRDVNAQIKPSTPSDAKESTKSLEYHRQVLESRMKDEQ